MDMFCDVMQTILPRPTSNHYPILLNGGGMRSGPSPFRFENMWLKEEGLRATLQGWWEGMNFQGIASFVLMEN